MTPARPHQTLGLVLRPTLFAAIAALAGLLAACGGSDDPPAAVIPTITTPPAAAAVTEGQSASFTVVATGSAPLAYQWRRNGSTIAGASAATYTLAAATLADNAAAFSVVVSNSAGSVTSAAAMLTVNPLAVIPTITVQPAPLVLTAGGNASFSATASGTPAPTLRWFIVDGADLADGAGTGPLAGATVTGAGSSTLTLTAVPQSANGLQVRLRATNTAGTAESSPAALTVNAATVAPSITSPPAAVTLTAGATATFTVAASGTPMPVVQWLIVGGADLADGAGSGALAGATIAGATTTTLTLTNVPQSANGVLLAARATNSAGSATSGSAALTVNSAGIAISAAAGGTATSPDGKFRAVFPPNAFTADTVVTFTPVPAPTLPSGSAPFAEDFASFQPVAGGFYRLDFAGGLLKSDVEVEYGLRSAGLAVQRSAQQVRRLSPQPANAPRAGVIRCSDGTTQVYMGTPGPDYDTVRAVLCGGDPSNNVTVGPAIVISPPSAPLGERTLARPGDDKLLSVISFNNGRSAFGFEGNTSGSFVYGLGIVAANGVISSGIPAGGGAGLVGFDGNGQVLATLSDCRLAAFGQRVSSLLGSFISTTPTWTAQLTVVPPFNLCDAQISAAAPTPGGGWVVADGSKLIRYSSTGVATPLTTVDFNGSISIVRLAVDAAGDIWAAGLLTSVAFGKCPTGDGFGGISCPALVKVSGANGAVLQQHILGGVLRRRFDRRIALTLDAAGNAYTAQASVESSSSNSANILVRRFAGNGTGGWGTRLSNSLNQEIGEIAVNSTGEVFVGTAEKGIVYRLDANGQQTGVVTVGAPFASSSVNGLSINPSGTLTYIGDLRGTLGSATSVACEPPYGGPCVDILVRRFNF
ncbi:MAG: hypothetical protein ACK54C_03475 [Betaproteobacteria bacterium]